MPTISLLRSTHRSPLPSKYTELVFTPRELRSMAPLASGLSPLSAGTGDVPWSGITLKSSTNTICNPWAAERRLKVCQHSQSPINAPPHLKRNSR